MKIFISFIGANDAGKLLNKEDEGSILTILQERKFDKIYLLHNTGAVVKKTDITYLMIAEYLKSEIIKNNYCLEENIIIDELTFENVADYIDVFPKLLNYLENSFSEQFLKEHQLYVGISSGTPAMTTSWILLSESDTLPLKLIRSVEKQYEKENKRVFDVDLLTGTKEKIERLKAYESRIGGKTKYNPFTVFDTLNLDKQQQEMAKSDNPILIVGETGVGKEVLAKTIHSCSSRNKHQIIALNCGGLSENIIESELFGHEKGAFTGATERKDGIVAVHQNGTLFLDEINSLPLSIQSKLLRFLENGEFRKLGSSKVENSRIRIIGASNEDLKQLVTEGKFREDLYYRLRYFELFIPPLRERKEQIPHLIQVLSSNRNITLDFTEQAIQELQAHRYNGNIRELKIIIERLSLYKDKMIDNQIIKNVLSDFKAELKYADIEIPSELHGKAFKLLRQMLTNAALNQTNGNTFAAAKILGVTHPSIKKYSEEEI